MEWDRKDRTGPALWILAGGIALGLATAFFLVRRRKKQPRIPQHLARLEDSVVDALRHDYVLRRRSIEVAALAAGIIELSGTVNSEAEAHQAVAVAQGTPGVRTVLNRLTAVEEERRVRQRSRPAADSGAGARWYGMNVGTGRRRQSPETDPPQRDDRVEMVEEALAPDAAAALDDLELERMEKRSKQANEVS